MNQSLCRIVISFAYASATTSSYSAATVSLGEFKPLFSQITLPGAGCPDSFVGKKFTKVVVSCDHPIAYEDGATVDLSTGKISGTPINSITYNLRDNCRVFWCQFGDLLYDDCRTF